MSKLNEIFVAIKETDYIEAQIGGLCEKYNNRSGADYVQQRALLVDGEVGGVSTNLRIFRSRNEIVIRTSRGLRAESN